MNVRMEPMLELEGRLEEDERGVYLDGLRKMIGSCAREVEQCLEQGLPPEEYEVAKGLQDGLASAVIVLEKVWSLMHQA